MQRKISLVVCIKAFSSEQDLYDGGASRTELERVDIAKGVLPVHDDVYSIQIH